MSTESAFTKKLAPETTMDKVEGLLEHFNLPPKVIDFIRNHKRSIQVVLGIVVIVVVSWSLYDSHVEKVREQAATALSLAMQKEGDGQAADLQKIVEDYKNTSSALWARIELAHLDMKAGSYGDASTRYSTLLQEVSPSDPLQPLLIFSLAQALESDNQFDKATAQYSLLKDIKGYGQIGFSGLGRLQEAQGNIEKAIAIYNNFLLQINDDPAMAQVKEEISGKIARLKARE